MTDLTPVFNDLAKKPPTQVQSQPSPDEFLKEAYRINAHISSLIRYLQSIRHSYLSTRKPVAAASSSGPGSSTAASGQDLTDPQRDEIDSSTALLLRNLSTSIATLSSAETLRQETSSTLLRKKHGTGRLWRWASGAAPSQGTENENETEDEEKKKKKNPDQRRDEGIARTTKTVRESVLWFLRHALDDAVGVQRGLVEKRIERVREKEKSVLYKAAGSVSVSANVSSSPMSTASTSMSPAAVAAAADISESEMAAIEAELSPEQLQLFAQENDSMIKNYEDTLVKVQSTEKSLLEIASLQQTLGSHLSTQDDYIQQLVTDATNTTTNVGQGNRELKRAGEARSTAQAMFWGTVGLSLYLVIWDLVF